MSSRKRANAARAVGVAALLCSLVVLAACTSNPYFIGASCPGADSASAHAPCGAAGSAGAAGSGAMAGSAGAAGASSNLNFAVDLDQSGASHLKSELLLPSGSVAATLRFRGETATANDWPSDQGALLVKAAAPLAVQLEAPFTDGTRAIGFSTDANAYLAQSAEPGTVDADDFALEVVLQAVAGTRIISKRADGVGWSVQLTAEGALTLEVTDDARTLLVSSEVLAPGAWYHCVFWLSRSAGGQAYCNGRASDVTDMSQLGSLATTTSLAVGGGLANNEPPPNAKLAHFSLFRVPVGALGPSKDWAALSRQRFAQLTGVSPRVARGSLLPRPGQRDSPAYLDLQRGIDGGRYLFLVGPDWPRITCRTDAAGVRDCGYLGEPERSRSIKARADAWTASQVTVLTDHADFADGERRMQGLVPSIAQVGHALSVSGTFGGAQQALSFFVRAGLGSSVGVSVTGRDRAVFDVAAGKVTTAPANAQAGIEPWGNQLFRCSLVFVPDAGRLTYQLQLLGPGDAELFAGDGKTAWLDVAGLQLDTGLAYSGSLLAADIQAADQLSFVGSDGNLPELSAASARLRVLLPAGPRLTDQSVLNLNHGGEFANQAEMYVIGDTSQLKFWGLNAGATHWAFVNPRSLVDGLRHQVEASWGPTSAELTVDGESVIKKAELANEPPFSFDRIDVGFSSNSSGSLEGLVAGIEIGKP
jgi:Concanavalin A-like lectin/glucanases superfamily